MMIMPRATIMIKFKRINMIMSVEIERILNFTSLRASFTVPSAEIVGIPPPFVTAPHAVEIKLVPIVEICCKIK